VSAPREGDRVEIGVVARAHGIRGEIVAVPHDPASDTLAHAGEIFLGARAYRVRAARPSNAGWLVALDGVATRDDAERLRGARIAVARDQLDLADGEVLLADLVGCDVVRAGDGAACGVVAAIDLGGQTRLVIHFGDVERLVPLVDALVPSIDTDARVVTIDLPDDWPSSPRR
jgi:16S rRNA processing protein RimM